MTSKVTRRDFLNGMAITVGAGMLAPPPLFGQPAPSGLSSTAPYYPPTLTGMRGSHKGSFEVAHALAWQGQKPAQFHPLNEHYDLVVVGSGISGLASAWFYQQKMGGTARILIMDNHDDFGGHAKRNEFHYEGRMVLGLGGAQNIDGLSAYSDEAASLFADIGISTDNAEQLEANTPDDFFMGGKTNAKNAMALPGTDGHVTVSGNWLRFMNGAEGYEAAVRELPLPRAEQDKLITFFSGDHDFLAEFSLSEMADYLNATPYNQFLTERVGLAKETLPILDNLLRIVEGYTGWNLTVLEAFGLGAPGIRSIGWLGDKLGALALKFADSLGETQMFPDGNASIARLLVQKLVPGVAPTMKGMEDVAIARFNYGVLDQSKQPNRIRLNSTVVGVRETEAKRVQVDYVQQGKALSVTADHCVLACYNGLIPHLCPQLPEPQKEALKYGVKTPHVYANVLLKNGQAFDKLGATMVQCPQDPFQIVSVAPTMTNGGYQPPRGSEDPMAVYMMGDPTPAPTTKVSGREMLRRGRYKVYSTPFASYEQQIRDQLQALLGPYGFNHETDIQAITVNRISHGYAYAYLALDDPEWAEGEAPHEVGRAQFGRISIANSDSEARAYMDAAIDAAWRAVQEQTA
ncbi:NAD(P)/FAD-dependent oxidoreductase [Oceanicoccus sagamiensis]|uniref:Tat pathway signal protein n=1 Tax=Oceanicoccus sagamiensis TaxID=716816 RepID=A0A1X9N5V3_9GAMM|nr:FAD/NAD(P)-binding protein [Oceanicoccus sagamiensis]ARN73106.1 Tat pathway signal protein [Oceanicoccus sagamiensis]